MSKLKIMGNDLNLVFGKRCFSLSFLDKEMEEVIKGCFYFSNTSRKSDYLFKIGYQDNGNVARDCEFLYFKGEKWCSYNTKKNEIEILFPKNETFSNPVRILAFLYDAFYKLGQVNGKRDSSFLIHAAGLLKHGKGFIFTGESGAGKTTVSQLSSPEAQILSDESIVVSEDLGEYWISQGPVKTEITRLNDKMVNLCAIFILVQDKTNSLRKLSGAEMGHKLMDNIIYVNLSAGAKREDYLAGKLRFIDAICRRVPVYELRFTKDKTFWKEIERKVLFLE